MDDALLKAMARLKDTNGSCISWSDIRDAMGKASGDRHLALFAFAIYRLIVFPKALGYYIDISRNRMEGSIDDSKHGTHRVQWSFVGSLNWHMGSYQLFLVDGPEILEEIRRDTNQVGSNLELAIRNCFQPFPFENVYLMALKKKKNLCVSAIQRKEEGPR
ncbi:hypothetical protein Gotur_011361 [Gossypium turneri]